MTELHGVFIRVDMDESVRADSALATKLAEACPVDIFAASGGCVTIVDENLDECVLCELCLDAAPPATVRVVKLYDGEAALQRSA